MVLLMKKTALVMVFISVLLFSAIVAQFVNLAEANGMLYWWQIEDEPIYGRTLPTINIHSPAENQSYTSNEVTLSFTVTKPADWLTSNGKIELVAYFLNNQPTRIEHSAINEENVVQVYDSGPIPSLSFRFSFNLTELKDGPHRVVVIAEGSVNGTEISTSKLRKFITYTLEEESHPETLAIPTPTPTPELESFSSSLVIASSITVAVVLVGIGLLLYGIKRK